MNGYNFSERVRKILAIARDVSSKWHNEYVNTEHILIALAHEGEGVGAAVLQNLGIDLTELKRRVEDRIVPGESAHPTGPDLPYTPRAVKVMELALTQSRDLKHSYVGSEHLLLGLLREGFGVAARTLSESGVTIDAARTETMRLLRMEPPPETPPASPPIAPPLAPPVPPLGTIDSVSIEVRLADGSNIRGEFRSIEAALHFLHNEWESSRRRDYG